MGGQLRTLIGAISDDPSRKISELPLLADAERHQLLVEWQDAEMEISRESTFLNLFARQVRNGPDRVALMFEGESLTYGELDRKASRLASHLRKLGISPAPA